LNAVDEHSLHSPFFFDLYKNVIKPALLQRGQPSIESLRQKLLSDRRVIHVTELGSGTAAPIRTIAAIAKTSLSSVRYSSLYAGIIQYFRAKNIVELGTCLGVNTLYLAQQKDAIVTTFEGAPQLAELAQLTFEFGGAKNINLIVGNIDRTLPAFIQSARKLDFIFMDANHRYRPTIQYFEQFLIRTTEKTILVMDDIHYSEEMEKAWNEIKHHRLIYGSADLYRCGILFFDPSLNKQHVILQV
jgi:predicted O-methyltransferase YrrM